MQGCILWVAQGFGLGRIPLAPGTFGSLGGLVWLALLLQTGQLGLFLAGTVLGLGLSVWVCGVAEGILQEKDAPSIVLDELSAVPVCFLGWILRDWVRTGQLPEPADLFTLPGLYLTALGFGLFRLFDIWKPWPVRSSQRLPGGWGVTVDDVLAAGYVALLTFLVRL